MTRYHFDCVFYYVTDLKRAVQFYEQVFGLIPSSHDDVARFTVDGVRFELVPAAVAPVGGGNARLALAVDDLDEAAAELRADRVKTSEVNVVSNGRFVTVHDPDGNEILVWQYAGKATSSA